MSVIDGDHWREIYEALRRNKARTFLTAFGVFWGIFMLMVMLASGNGLWNGVSQDFRDGATNSVFIWSQRTSKPYRGLPTGRQIQLDAGDAEALRAQLADAEVVCPRNELGGFRGGNIGTRVAEVLFAKNESPLHESIRINGVTFEVIGTFKPKRPDGGDRNEEAQTIFVPFTTFQSAFHFGDRVGWFALVSKPGVPASSLETKALALLKGRHRIDPDDARALGHYNSEIEYNQITGLFTGIRALVWIVGIGTLAAGVIGVSNIMLVIVRERTSEIGIRRAVGATPLTVMGQIVFEALVLTTLAGYLGLVAGVGVVEAIARAMAANPGEMFRDPEVPFQSALTTLLILVVSGVLAGLIPARRAVKISTVEALRGV